MLFSNRSLVSMILGRTRAGIKMMARGMMDSSKIEKKRAVLLEYCARETLAMVRLHEVVENLTFPVDKVQQKMSPCAVLTAAAARIAVTPALNFAKVSNLWLPVPTDLASAS